MKIEQEIDAVLKLLSETQPPATMVSRVHQSLETATAEAHRARSSRLFWIPATCTALAAVLLAVFFQVHSAREKLASTTRTAKMVTPAALPDRVMTPPAPVASEAFRERELPPPRARLIFRQQRGEYRHATNLLSYPLTRQEKLLVRFVQTAKPADLRDLNLENQVKMEAVQDAEFVAYLKLSSSPSYNEATENTQE